MQRRVNVLAIQPSDQMVTLDYDDIVYFGLAEHKPQDSEDADADEA